VKGTGPGELLRIEVGDMLHLLRQTALAFAFSHGIYQLNGMATFEFEEAWRIPSSTMSMSGISRSASNGRKKDGDRLLVVMSPRNMRGLMILLQLLLNTGRL
jgi:hypothetical protein